MKKMKFSPLLFFVCFFLLVGFVWFYNLQNSPSRVEAHHSELYSGAKGLFDSNLKADFFLPKEVNGKTVGSSTSFEITWKHPRKKFHHFRFTVSDPKTDFTRTEAGDHERTRLDLADLNSETEYVAAVRACLDKACDKWLISDHEAWFTTDQEYWEIASEDNSFKTLTGVWTRDLKRSNEDDRSGYDKPLIPEKINFVWNDSSLLEKNDSNMITVDKIVVERGWEQQRLEFSAKKEKPWFYKKGFAVFLNP